MSSSMALALTPLFLMQSITPCTSSAGVVRRVYTNLAVLEIGPSGVLVREMVEGLGIAELQAKTEPKLRLAEDWKPIAAPSM